MVIDVLRDLIRQVCVDRICEAAGAYDFSLIHGNVSEKGKDHQFQITADHMLGAKGRVVCRSKLRKMEAVVLLPEGPVQLLDHLQEEMRLLFICL